MVISSIRVAYWVTASIPPLMLLLMCIGLVRPCLVLILASRFGFSLSVRFQVAPVHPFLSMVYITASIHALS